MWTLIRLERLWQDAVYGARLLKNSPGFTLVAIVTLALGIGASTAIFSVVNGVLLRPLPYESPDRLVYVWETNPHRSYSRNVVNPINFLDWLEQNNSFSSMAAIVDTSATLNAGGEPVSVSAILATPQLFSILGVKPVLGRSFVDDDGIGHEKTAILSYEFWQQQFGGRPDVLNKTIRVNDETGTIVGVMPRGFALPNVRGKIWLPYALDRNQFKDTGRYLVVIGRLKTEVTLAQAQDDMQRVAARTVELRPSFNEGWSALVAPMLEDATLEIRRPLLVLLSAVGFVLLIACANVANLLLMRGTRRRQEIAVRAALGAGRSRIVQQLFVESLLIALAGTLAGLGTAKWGLQALLSLVPAAVPLPRMQSIHMDGEVFLFAFVLTFLTTIFFGLIPAIRLSRVNLQGALRQGTLRSGVGGHQTLRRSFVVVEVALALLLSVGAGLLLRSFQRLTHVDLGFQTERVVTMRVFASPAKYADERKRAQYMDNLLNEVRHTAGIQSAGSVHFLPLMDRVSGSCFVMGANPPVNDASASVAQYLIVSSGYFAAMGTPFLDGRDFADPDKTGAPSVAIVNQAFVKKYVSEGDAIGKLAHLCWNVPNPVRIVGIVADARQTRLKDAPVPTIFLPNAQSPMYAATVVMRAAGDPREIMRSAVSAVHRFDPDQAPSEVQAMDTVFSDSASEARFQLTLLLIFAGIAVALAVIGVYGVVSYSVGQRTQEIGIRMAMGAERSRIAGMVLREAVVLSGLAVILGLAGALALTRALQALLYETAATDPFTLAGASAVVLLVAILAALLPTRRAMTVDPMVALRHE